MGFVGLGWMDWHGKITICFMFIVFVFVECVAIRMHRSTSEGQNLFEGLFNDDYVIEKNILSSAFPQVR